MMGRRRRRPARSAVGRLASRAQRLPLCLAALSLACAHAPKGAGPQALGFEGGEASLDRATDPAAVERLCRNSERVLEALRDGVSTGAGGGPALVRSVAAFDRAALIATQTASVIGEVHPAADVRDAARTCATRLSALVSDAVIGPLWTSLQGVEGLDAADARYVSQILTSARRNGAGLSLEGRRALAALRARERVLTAGMTEALGAPAAPLRVEPGRLRGLPDAFFKNHPAGADGKVALEPAADLPAVTSFAADRALAAELFRQRAIPANVPALRELLEVRRRAGALRGCGSFVRCEAASRMVGTPERTERFLAEMVALADRYAPRYRALLGLADGAPRPTEWDGAGLVERAAPGKQALTEWLSYFEAEPTLRRVLEVAGEVLGLRFVEVRAPSWSPEVLVFDAERADGSRAGRFYFDLYLRPGKPPNSGSSTPFVERSQGSPRSAPAAIAISITLRPPAPGQPAVLTNPWHLSLLLHELGHGIHFLHTTESALFPSEEDFYDVPSQLLERLAADPAFLQRIGRHVRTGEPLPVAGAQALVRSRLWDQWRDARRRTLFGLVDLRYHGDTPPKDLAAAYAEAYERLFPFRSDVESHPEASLFIPTIVYAGNGHALPWGQAIAADLAGSFAGRGLTDPAAWARFVDEVLEGDGPAEPRIERFLGRPWTVDRLALELAPLFER